MRGRSDEDECHIVPPIGAETLKSMEDASCFRDNMPQIGGSNVQLVEGALIRWKDPRLGAKASNDREINFNRWKK